MTNLWRRFLESTDPKTAKALGRTVKNFDGDLWKANARRLVTEGNIAKLSRTAELRAFLVGTGNLVLVEASPMIAFGALACWLMMNDPRIHDLAGTEFAGVCIDGCAGEVGISN